MLQSLFNNWSEHGYVKAPLNRDLPGLVTDPANNGRWYLTDDHLKISKDFVLAGAKAWKGIPDEWKITLENKKESLLKFKSASSKRPRDMVQRDADLRPGALRQELP